VVNEGSAPFDNQRKIQKMFNIINSRVLLSGATIIAAAAVIIGGAFAFFSDTETSQNNALVAGELDLKIDNTSYYNGAPNSGTSWLSDDLPGHLFFNFDDIKPSDFGEDTISLLVQNDAWACMNITLTKNDDNNCTEPELLDDPSCTDPGAPGNANLFDGELSGLINFAFWADDGDNVYELDETIFKTGTASALFNGDNWTLADSSSSIWPTPGPLPGNETRYIGKAWCFGTLIPAPVLAPGNNDPTVNSGFVCDGSATNNASQTDSLMGDISFSAVQHRNNPNFTCDGTVPSVTPTPTPPLACSQADVMLVLDRSGSINSTELGQLKTAAKDFVDDLGLTPTGIHAGKSSFATTGNLNHHLTSDPTSLKTAIDAIVSGGFTNLKEGIDLAKTEMDNPGDSHDRSDGTSPDKMIIITDGHPNRPLPSGTAATVAKASADAARAAGVEVFVVGVGSDVNTAYLQTVADDASHYYSVSGYGGLQTILQNIDLCE